MDAMLALPTGKLIVGDPGRLYGDARPLTAELPAGSFPVTVGPRRVEVRLGEQEPERWLRDEGFATPSGYGCLLDAAALPEFTDLGDAPVDEYELLSERLAARPGAAVEFRGLVVFPAPGPIRGIALGYDRDERVCRVVTEF